ncbi:MAG: dihydroxyacetone kinase-like protein [Psychromonas sp.]|jgi:dihydroxyacetone kinase-like protein|uniref:dihydroxyacetone kinase subunit DhaL n=1 Tax=Psychromonas sp. TaxID=1884585 RepID=UPI0039E6B388
MNLSQQQILQWLQECCRLFEQEQDLLTQLDADIGDADHGLNMHRGFTRVAEKLPTLIEQPITSILKTVGITLLSSVGGVTGPLYGTFFLRAATAVEGKEALDLRDVAEMLGAGLAGIIDRGNAEVGDKTLCDLWWPVVEAANQAAQQGLDMQNMLTLLTQIAHQAAHSTIAMRAKKGRASYLGVRSIGHQDPGATSSLLMVIALHSVIQNT